MKIKNEIEKKMMFDPLNSKTAEEMLDETDRLTDTNLRLVRDTIIMGREAREIGSASASILHRQGEQIQRITGTLEQIDDLQTTADYHINAIESPLGNLKSKPKKSRKKSDNKTNKGKNPKSTIKEKQSDLNSDKHQADVLKVLRPETQQKQKQIDQGLDEILYIVDGIGQLAKDLNIEIRSQNSELEAIEPQMQGILTKMNRTTRKIHDI